MTQIHENTPELASTISDLLPLATRYAAEIAPIAESLVMLPAALREHFEANTQASKQVINHIFAVPGKLIRPSLFLMSAQLTKYSGEHLLPIAVITEYVHTASLLHDDVVDQSSIRRGSPTANSIWGNQSSVLVGDLIYAAACEIMASTGKVELVSIFAKTIRQMSDGELQQMNNSFKLSTSIDDYIKALEGKTGALLGASCAAAGIMAEASKNQIECLRSFGSRLGVAFQLIDDALDYSSSTGSIGKPTLADITEGKLTLPVLKLKELATSSELTKLEDILATKDILEEDRLWIASLVKTYGTIGKTIDKAEQYTNAAIEDLCANFHDCEERNRLVRLANLLVERTS